ncbi:MAG: type III pantothenate kinase [Proteobacteria bacterium]|nr:type III pantothenate kinase [Pseudomonadota bacterium]
MLLAIDGGNTNTVFAVFDDAGALIGQWRAATKTAKTSDELAIWLRQLMALEKIDERAITEVIIATVVPAGLFDLQTLSRKYFGCEPLIVGDPGVKLGFDVRVPRPAEVGADRLVNAVAGFEAHGGPLLIVDFGTATTFDVIAKDGAYLGGVIAPGVNLSLEALQTAAAKLPRIDIVAPERVMGTDTISAMRSGIYHGYASMIEGMIQRLRAEQGAMDVIATGGLAPLFAAACPSIKATDGDLTLRGLYAINARNRG